MAHPIRSLVVAALQLALLPAATAQVLAIHETEVGASDALAFDRFGFSVALDGDTAVVGANQDDHDGKLDAGAAYVFVRSGATWTQQFKLTASDAAANDNFGNAVAISGDTVIVGAYQDDNGGGPDAGSVYVFVRSGVTWSQQAKLVAMDASQDAVFGFAASLDGDTALIGAYGDGHGGLAAGAAYVFERSGTAWSQESKLTASDGDTDDAFGWAVSLSGDTAVVGALLDDHAGGSNAGSVYVFTRTTPRWTEEARLSAADATTNDGFGWAVSLAGDTLLVGASLDDEVGGINAGSAYVFQRDAGVFSQQAKLLPSDGATNDDFGWSVGVEGDTAIVGAALDNTGAGNDAGSAYVFTRSGTAWTQQVQLTAPDAAAGDEFGFAAALSGSHMIFGGVAHDGTGTDSGAAYTYRLANGATWLDLGSGLAGVTGVPLLVGSGTLVAGSPGTLGLSNAEVGAVALLFVSFSSTPTPFRGGTLLPFPYVLALALVTDGTGAIPLGWASWPAGFPPGTPLYFQYAIQDAAAPVGAALSNALQATTP